MSASVADRYRLDDLRRFASDLAIRAGVPPARASSLASHLLWFDAAGAPSRGIASLPSWLERIDRGEIHPSAEGRARGERAGTAIFDGQRGLPPLILSRAGEIATQKARELGVGVVRVVNLGPGGPAAPVAAEMAVGPYAVAVVGPGPSWTVAMPMPEGPPALFDSALAADSSPPAGLGVWAAWASAIAGEDGWAILALAVPALEPLSGFHERVSASLSGTVEGEGCLLPGPWDARRREARERGVALDDAAWAGLRARAGSIGLPCPTPIGA